METIRIDLARLKTQEEALRRFKSITGMPGQYTGELSELHDILKNYENPLKIEIVIGGNISPFTGLMEMLEDVRISNDKLLFVVIMHVA